MDPKHLKSLPPELRRRVVGINVETTTLLQLGPSDDRITRLEQLQKEARECAEACQAYIEIEFVDVPHAPPKTWREAQMLRLLREEDA